MKPSRRDPDPLLDRPPSRYVVGIDLGTTNSAAAYVNTEQKPWRVRDFLTPQLTAAGQVETRETLPSFHFQPAQGQWSAEALRLPWSRETPEAVVGVWARDEGTKTPGRLIASAKSWLCHSGVDRTAPLLPWQGAADIQRLSPVEVSARYLGHLRDAWNASFPRHPLADQDIVLTLPASFDEVARELTVAAAAQAALPRVVLIEEPQAAFYAWVYRRRDDWRTCVRPGQKILVCDIGGGTSDFTLIRVRLSGAAANGGDAHDQDRIQFHRVAVGEHLILGGDNLDLALARHVERKLAGEGKLPPEQWDVLTRSCRRAKEQLLGENGPPRLTVILPGAGSRVIGGGLQAEITREEANELLLEGFLPQVALHDKPQRRQSGFQEFGLPYAADPAITRYLAAFLTAHRDVALDAVADRQQHDPARPDVVLLNGGFFASPVLRGRLLQVLGSWFPELDGSPWRPLMLDHDRLDLAVARGAAYYGMVRRGEGVRIAAGLARSYYIGLESRQPSAVCLVPGNAEPGSDWAVENREFQLRISEPVEFPLYVSSTRLTDQAGDVVAVDAEQMTGLPPIRTVLKARRRSEAGSAPVQLKGRLTEIGTIELWCAQVGSDRSWRLQFDVRSATRTDVAAAASQGEGAGLWAEDEWQPCWALLKDVFEPSGEAKPAGLVKRLAQTLGSDRWQWPPSLLRRIWEALMDLESGRRRSAEHEARWLNLLGFALRPGYGMAVDDWRVAETWRVAHNKFVHASPAIRAESLILWRRLAGGLSAGQQVTVAEQLLGQVRTLHQQCSGQKRRHGEVLLKPKESIEAWRLLGSLELLPVPVKVQLGDMAASLMDNPKLEGVRGAIVWALGRLGQRIPVYGPLNTVAPRQKAAAWLQAIIASAGADAAEQLAVMQLARRSDDRHRDLDEPLRREAVSWLVAQAAPEHLVKLVRDGGRLDAEEQDRVLGESLPKGLRIDEPVLVLDQA